MFIIFTISIRLCAVHKSVVDHAFVSGTYTDGKLTKCSPNKAWFTQLFFYAELDAASALFWKISSESASEGMVTGL